MRIGRWILLGTALAAGPALAADRPGRGQLEAERTALFTQADADANGVLTSAEFDTFERLVRERRHQHRFQRLDADGDGGVTLAELQAFRPKRGRGPCGGGGGGPDTP